MTLNEFEPKYKTLEVINFSKGTVQLLELNVARYLYGEEYNVVSVRNYDRSKRTSIIIKKAKKGEKNGTGR